MFNPSQQPGCSKPKSPQLLCLHGCAQEQLPTSILIVPSIPKYAIYASALCQLNQLILNTVQVPEFSSKIVREDCSFLMDIFYQIETFSSPIHVRGLWKGSWFLGTLCILVKNLWKFVFYENILCYSFSLKCFCLFLFLDMLYFRLCKTLAYSTYTDSQFSTGNSEIQCYMWSSFSQALLAGKLLPHLFKYAKRKWHNSLSEIR